MVRKTTKPTSGTRSPKKQSAGNPESKPVAGGEVHQIAGGQHPALTTNQGVALSDNQNSLKANPARPGASRDFILRRRSRILITSAFPNASFTREPPVYMDISSCPLRSRNTQPPEYSPRLAKYAGLYTIVDRCRRCGFGGHASGRTRVCSEVLYERRKLGSGGE